MLNLFGKNKGWKEHFDEGMKQGAAGRLAEAATSFRAAAHKAPNEPYPHYELGYTLSLQGYYNEALTALQRAEELCRGFFLVQTEIDLCRQMLNGTLPSEALDALRQLQQLTDSSQGDTAQAIEKARYVIDLSPSCALGHFYLGKALMDNDESGALASLQRCLELKPDETTAIDAKTNIGLVLFNSGNQEKARQLWQEVATEYTDNPHSKVVQMVLLQTASP